MSKTQLTAKTCVITLEADADLADRRAVYAALSRAVGAAFGDSTLLTFDSANEPDADVDADDRYDDYTVQDIDEAWELQCGDIDEEESGDAYWRLREIAMPDNEGGPRLDIPDDQFDRWGYMPEVDHCERCGGAEGLIEFSAGHEAARGFARQALPRIERREKRRCMNRNAIEREKAIERAVSLFAKDIMLGRVSLDLVRLANRGGCDERRRQIQA